MEEREAPVEAQSCWIDGALLPRRAAVVLATDSAFCQGRGCFTTARFRAGRIRFAERHAERLLRDARRLGLGEIERTRVLEALSETANACFERNQQGLVRVQASRDGAGVVHLTAVPRELGPEPTLWRAGSGVTGRQ